MIASAYASATGHRSRKSLRAPREARLSSGRGRGEFRATTTAASERLKNSKVRLSCERKGVDRVSIFHSRTTPSSDLWPSPT
jgi:hypothetical protein